MTAALESGRAKEVSATLSGVLGAVGVAVAVVVLWQLLVTSGAIGPSEFADRAGIFLAAYGVGLVVAVVLLGLVRWFVVPRSVSVLTIVAAWTVGIGLHEFARPYWWVVLLVGMVVAALLLTMYRWGDVRFESIVYLVLGSTFCLAVVPVVLFPPALMWCLTALFFLVSGGLLARVTGGRRRGASGMNRTTAAGGRALAQSMPADAATPDR